MAVAGQVRDCPHSGWRWLASSGTVVAEWPATRQPELCAGVAGELAERPAMKALMGMIPGRTDKAQEVRPTMTLACRAKPGMLAVHFTVLMMHIQCTAAPLGGHTWPSRPLQPSLIGFCCKQASPDKGDKPVPASPQPEKASGERTSGMPRTPSSGLFPVSERSPSPAPQANGHVRSDPAVLQQSPSMCLRAAP